jgi:deoxyribose-phosphate aldolase
MRQHLPNTIEIKASGGIRNYSFAKELIDAGATRLGCSASIAIVEESRRS